MPEQKNLALCSGKSAAKDDLGAAIENWREDFRILIWIILEVRILKDREVAGHLRDGSADGRSFAHVHGLLEDLDDPGIFLRETFHHFPRRVFAPVIHDDEFALKPRRKVCCKHSGNACAKSFLFVVCGHEDG